MFEGIGDRDPNMMSLQGGYVHISRLWKGHFWKWEDSSSMRKPEHRSLNKQGMTLRRAVPR